MIQNISIACDAVFGAGSENFGTVTGNVTFQNGSANSGTVNGNATFEGTAENKSGATVTGNATFNGTSVNAGTVGGNATFADTATNSGTVSGAVDDASSREAAYQTWLAANSGVNQYSGAGSRNGQWAYNSTEYGSQAEAQAAYDAANGGGGGDSGGGGGGGGFSSYAASFDGSSRLVINSGNGSLGVGSGDFTVEAFIKRNGIGTENIFIDQPGGIQLYFDGSLLTFNQAGIANLMQVSVPADNGWHHVAVVRNGGVIELYWDGSVVGTTNDSRDFTTGGPGYISGSGQGVGEFSGMISNVRVSNIARYPGAIPTSNVSADGNAIHTWLQGASVDGDLIPGGSVSMVQGPF